MAPFRVLIAGGSVVGLTLANALEKAGIDYLVLEKRDIAPPVGASISVLCHTARVFEQLGVWDRMYDSSLGLAHRQHFDENGCLFEDSGLFALITRITKRPFLFMERKFYLQCLYDNLEDKSKVRSRCGVQDFVETDDGVTVITDTGETIYGSILIGADGVHSTVRQLMANSAGTASKTAKSMIEGFTTNYKALFGTSNNHCANDPERSFLPNGMVHNVYYRNVSGVAAAGAPDRVFWFLFVKLESPSLMPNCLRFTEADIKTTLREYGDRRLGSGYTFNDLWAARIGGGMVPMEEGVLMLPWNNERRTLLMGDSVAKSTVNVGLGGNTAVEGIVTFMNELVPLLKRYPPGTQPTAEDVVGLFDRYEAKHRPRADLCVKMSHYVTRYEAMDTWWLRIIRWLSPWIPEGLKAKGFLDFMAPAPIFRFLPDPDKKHSG
ncbi:Zeaxanthin epoxidase, chloroplastic [Pleurostoma richardsiae]|uniref:Zeaxanthin epoxidase, chloroplastic n=1 Tax=Pleurostoma richardsiae TaxID=41990 RepID=A0AA38R6U6_9PEZI|nr:Zeaxanthin epoxidase, chloroplastic [Pleurostoma richardsiae]